MRAPNDLDPEDRSIRIALGRTLRQIRDVDNISIRRIADRVGVAPAAVRNVEQHHNWTARIISRHARALDWRIEWVVDGLTVPTDDDIMAVIVAAGDTSTPERADAVHWRTTWNNLRRIRRGTCTAIRLASILGVTDNAIHYAETNPDGTTVITAQRHARALGGRLGWRLHPARYAGRPVSFTEVLP